MVIIGEEKNERWPPASSSNIILKTGLTKYRVNILGRVGARAQRSRTAVLCDDPRTAHDNYYHPQCCDRVCARPENENKLTNNGRGGPPSAFEIRILLSR